MVHQNEKQFVSNVLQKLQFGNSVSQMAMGGFAKS